MESRRIPTNLSQGLTHPGEGNGIPNKSEDGKYDLGNLVTKMTSEDPHRPPKTQTDPQMMLIPLREVAPSIPESFEEEKNTLAKYDLGKYDRIFIIYKQGTVEKDYKSPEVLISISFFYHF